MYTLRVLLFACALSFTAAAYAQVKAPASFDTIYVPGGFDSNDNVQFVSEGLFRNTCYRPAPTDITVDHDKKIITVGPSAYEYSGMCLQVILPFERVVDVGMLEPGNYKIVQEPGHSTLGSVNIGAALTQAPDDYLYAPISQAFFKQKGMTSQVLLSGYFLSNCMVLDEVKVTIEPKVIVLQPIVKMIDRHQCERGRFPFSKVVDIKMIPKGRYLLHVRSMNGQSVNSLVEVN